MRLQPRLLPIQHGRKFILTSHLTFQKRLVTPLIDDILFIKVYLMVEIVHRVVNWEVILLGLVLDVVDLLRELIMFNTTINIIKVLRRTRKPRFINNKNRLRISLLSVSLFLDFLVYGLLQTWRYILVTFEHVFGILLLVKGYLALSCFLWVCGSRRRNPTRLFQILFISLLLSIRTLFPFFRQIFWIEHWGVIYCV